MTDMTGAERLQEITKKLAQAKDDPEKIATLLAEIREEASRLGAESAALWQIHDALAKLSPPQEEG